MTILSPPESQSKAGILTLGRKGGTKVGGGGWLGAKEWRAHAEGRDAYSEHIRRVGIRAKIQI